MALKPYRYVPALESEGQSSPNKLGMCFHVDDRRPKNPLFRKKRLYRRILEPLLGLLRQGISPDRLALCVAIGMVVGNVPILGISTILCTAIALAFGLNLPAIQLVQAAMAPTQILLIIPFVRLGEWILRVPAQSLSIKEGLGLLAHGAGDAIAELGGAILRAGFAWSLIAPPAVWLFYKFLTPVFERAAVRMR